MQEIAIWSASIIGYIGIGTFFSAYCAAQDYFEDRDGVLRKNCVYCNRSDEWSVFSLFSLIGWPLVIVILIAAKLWWKTYEFFSNKMLPKAKVIK